MSEFYLLAAFTAEAAPDMRNGVNTGLTIGE